MHRADHAPLAPLLEQLRRAARQRRRVAMVYQSRSRPGPLERELDPYALVHRWGWWYVIGYCHLRDALRTFRVDRIQELTLLRDTYEVPDDFDIHQYLAEETWFPPQFRVRMRFTPQAAREALDERAYWESTEEEPDGSLVVTFGAAELQWAARVALWHGPEVEVLEPEELRQRVKELARAVVNVYRPAA
jgi:predicted DNA-binding transcriptional regulator YafY